ncbi:493_t:CDS:1 [Racocetra persica]|uniref:493_t:CDS:1 n=1 Tax=Racocetra persica TaxID=160502 RepID=A0ACA9MLA1_9GLOM|nr:493_t:CDS:1 [Racocetra persica]
MSPTPRYNVTIACDYCRRLKTRCQNLDQSAKCSKCKENNVECIYRVCQGKRGRKPKPTPPSNDELDSSQEEIEFVVNDYELPYDSTQEKIELVANNKEEIELVANYHKLYAMLHDLSQPEELVANVHEMYEMLCDLSQPIVNDYDLSRDSSQELVDTVHELFRNSSQEEILTSTSSLPCPHENTAGHCCHMGCIIR